MKWVVVTQWVRVDGGGNTMVSHLFYYQLAVLAIVWLFIMLHLTWPKRGMTPPPAPAPSLRRPRSKEPKPFVGLTTKPHCARCEQGAAHPQPPPPVPPEPMPQPTDVPARWTPRSISVPIPAVAIAAGSGWETCSCSC